MYDTYSMYTRHQLEQLIGLDIDNVRNTKTVDRVGWAVGYLYVVLGVSGRVCMYHSGWAGMMYRDVRYDSERKGEGTEHKLHENKLIIKFTINHVVLMYACM